KCDGIEQIEIPDTVTEIGARAFCECKNLKDITIYNDVVKIGDRVFLDCTSLTQAILPDTVESMGPYIFSGCTALQKVHLPSGRVNVPDGTFKNCKKLTEVNFPSTLQYIRSDAFYGCETLPEAVLPSGMLGIEQNAFYGCKALKKVVIPDTVTNLEDRIFYGCEGLSDVSLGTGITSIPDSTFYGCAALSEIVIPYNVTTIGDSAFVNCVNLTSVTIPRNTTSIASNAFSYPKKMTIYGIAGTYAEQYAKEKGITFVHKEVKATAVSLNKTSLTLENGSSEVLAFTVTPKNFTDVVTWKSSNTDVVTVTDAGEVEAVGGGIATVRLTVGSVSADCTVTVNQPVEWLDLSEYDLELDVFETAQLSVTVYPSDATNKAVTWSSSNPNVATVNANGLVTAKAKGTATIKATAKDGSGEWDSCEVTVRNKEVTAISINQSNLELEESKTAQLSVTVYPSDAMNKAVTWSSSNSSVATVDANGLVTAKAKGTATIKATAKDGSGAWDSCSVTVVKKTVQPKNISSCTATLKTTSYTYNGKERKPGVTVKDGSKTLTKDTDYTVSYAKNINKGTAEVTIKGKGNYTGSKKLTFTINAKKISDVKVSGIADQYYTGKAIKPGVTVKDGSVKLVKDTDYTLSYSDNKKTGTATVTMKGKGNYTGSKKVTFKIVKKVSTVKASSAGYNSVKVSWSSIKGVSGYKIYRSTSKNGKYSLVKTIKEWDTTSYKDTKLTTGKAYYYKVTPYKSSKNGTASKIVSAKPVPATPKISSVKNSAAKTATVKWEQVSGASGYEVYRATSKDGKYSKVKTIGSGKTISYKNTKLSKGKTYYYKVRAYRTVNGKKIYGSYSSVKSVKISK
ncbi:MAG: leucine-rich repeat protein, partial [Roseburia sp.]